VDVCVCEDMMKIYTALKENEILPFGATWNKPEHKTKTALSHLYVESE
jgi:hypothetical protein